MRCDGPYGQCFGVFGGLDQHGAVQGGHRLLAFRAGRGFAQVVREPVVVTIRPGPYMRDRARVMSRILAGSRVARSAMGCGSVGSMVVVISGLRWGGVAVAGGPELGEEGVEGEADGHVGPGLQLGREVGGVGPPLGEPGGPHVRPSAVRVRGADALPLRDERTSESPGVRELPLELEHPDLNLGVRGVLGGLAALDLEVDPGGEADVAEVAAAGEGEPFGEGKPRGRAARTTAVSQDVPICFGRLVMLLLLG